jgi:hypothetical protein
MHIYIDPCCYISDSPGVNPATNDRMILYYCLMTKVEWFRRSYDIFLGGLSHPGWAPPSRVGLLSNLDAYFLGAHFG